MIWSSDQCKNNNSQHHKVENGNIKKTKKLATNDYLVQSALLSLETLRK